MGRSWRARRADLDHAAPAPTGGAVAPHPSRPVPEAPSAVLGSVPPWYEQLGAEVLGGLTFPWSTRLPGWTVCFLPGREGLLGGTWTYEQRIEIYVRAEQPRDDVAFTVAHELGHAVDVTLLDEADRLEWRRQRGLAESVPWWVESGASDLSSGSGDWAEAFAVWLVGGTSHSRVAPHPTADDLAAVARLSGETPALAPAGELPTLAA
jgi:hypothetical protein